MRKPRTIRQLWRIEEWLSSRMNWNIKFPGKKSTVITPENLTVAFDYEKSLLSRLKFRLPKKGESYRAVRDVLASAYITFNGAYSSSAFKMISKGTIVRIEYVGSRGLPVLIYAKPINYAEMENYFVPKDELEDPKYNGYFLRIMTTEFGDGFCSFEH